MSVGNSLSFIELFNKFVFNHLPNLISVIALHSNRIYRFLDQNTIPPLKNMLFSLLSGWNNPPANSNKTIEHDDIGTLSENRNPNKPVPKPGIHPLVSEQLKKSVDLSRGRLKHRDAAILIMRMLIKSDARLSEYCPTFYCHEYLNFLDELEQVNIDTASFGSKHVLGVEGLQYSGKSNLIDSIHKHLPKMEIIRRHDIPDVIQRHSETACIAWEFLENYRIAHEVVGSSAEIFIIENYYHHFLTKYLQRSVKNEEEVNNLSYASFAWPFDLPMPELVLFLTTTTEIRLARQEEQSKGPTTIIPGTYREDEVVVSSRDSVANAIFAAIRGPSTVGIDTSSTPNTVFSTALEALEYFGFYCISRGVVLPQKSHESTELQSSHATPAEEVPIEIQDDYSFMTSYDAPMLPADVISNRRISMGRVSMGVYGMYSKF